MEEDLNLVARISVQDLRHFGSIRQRYQLGAVGGGVSRRGGSILRGDCGGRAGDVADQCTHAEIIVKDEGIAAERAVAAIRAALSAKDVLGGARGANPSGNEVSSSAFGAGYVREASEATDEDLRAGLAGDIEAVADQEEGILAGGAELCVGAGSAIGGTVHAGTVECVELAAGAGLAVCGCKQSENQGKLHNFGGHV